MLELDAATLARRLDRAALIEALARAFREPCEAPPRQHHALGASSGALLLMPAWNARLCGVKLVTVFPDNGARGLPAVAASYLVFSAQDGRLLALLDGGELTARRTAAASALAARELATPEARRLLMVGTGRLAPHLIESHCVVRGIEQVRIWGRHTERAHALARRLRRGSLDIEATSDLEDAVRWADVISCATLAREPLVRGEWLRPGQHLDLVGAFTPQMCETDDAALARASIFVDTRSGALAESGELIGALERAVIQPSAILAELAELGTGRFHRPSPTAITLFKSVGAALEDLAAAELALNTP